MPHFKVTHPWAGFEGIFEAETFDAALDDALEMLARQYGYRDYRQARLAGRLDAIELNVERVHDDGSTEHIFPCY